jgi:hypothetical protein
MNLHELTLFMLLLALMAIVALVVGNDDQWPHV